MKGETSRFDIASEQFVGYYDTVRGYVRQEVTRRNLVDFLPGGASLNVLDFGGGDGRDAIWLAGMGDKVTVLDESPEMIAKAEATIKDEKLSIRKRVTLLRGNFDQLPDKKFFDVALSHGVLMYELDDPLGQLRSLAARLRTGGVLSLLTKGYEAARRNSEASEQNGHFADNGTYINRLGLPTQVYRFHELEKLVAQAGFETRARYGVRLLSDGDHRNIKDFSRGELNKIVSAEAEAGSDPARMEEAQMLHIIAIKK